MLPYLKEMGDAAGDRPIVLINPRLTDIPSANNGAQQQKRPRGVNQCGRDYQSKSSSVISCLYADD